MWAQQPNHDRAKDDCTPLHLQDNVNIEWANRMAASQHTDVWNSVSRSTWIFLDNNHLGFTVSATQKNHVNPKELLTPKFTPSLRWIKHPVRVWIPALFYHDSLSSHVHLLRRPAAGKDFGHFYSELILSGFWEHIIAPLECLPTP